METIRERRMRKKREMQEAYHQKHVMSKEARTGNIPTYAKYVTMAKSPMSRQSKGQLMGLDSGTTKDISKYFK